MYSLLGWLLISTVYIYALFNECVNMLWNTRHFDMFLFFLKNTSLHDEFVLYIGFMVVDLIFYLFFRPAVVLLLLSMLEEIFDIKNVIDYF